MTEILKKRKRKPPGGAVFFSYDNPSVTQGSLNQQSFAPAGKEPRLADANRGRESAGTTAGVKRSC